MTQPVRFARGRGLLREKSYAHDQSIGAGGKRDPSEEDDGACPVGLSPEEGRVRARLHDDAQETELGPAQGGAGPIDQRNGGQRLHPR